MTAWFLSVEVWCHTNKYSEALVGTAWFCGAQARGDRAKKALLHGILMCEGGPMLFLASADGFSEDWPVEV